MSGASMMRSEIKLRIPGLLLVFLFLLSSCHDNKTKNVPFRKPDENDMAELNRYFITKDKERIQNYIERKGLKMNETSTGLWYQILEEGEGDNISDGDKVLMEYECSLLDGTKCYSSQTLGPKELVLGKSEMEAGMNEGLRLLKPGSRAIFILPPFLAYGLVGDRKMIPSRAVVVYNVNILRTLK